MADDGGASESSFASYSAFGSCDELVRRVFVSLAHEGQIASRDHILVVELIISLKNSIERETHASKISQMRLICVLTSLLRRRTRLDEQIAKIINNSTDYDEAEVSRLRAETMDFHTTSTLVFVLVVSLDVSALGGIPAEVDSSLSALDAAMGRSLWDSLARHSRKRHEFPEELQYNERMRMVSESSADRPYVVSESSTSWSGMLAQPAVLANSAVRAAGSLLSSETDDFEEFRRLADIFSRATADQMHVQMLKSDRNFVSLSSQRVMQLGRKEREDALSSVIGAAESESGQAVLRDILLSFLLPRGDVGQRRTLLMPRNTAERATRNFPWLAGLAHEAAMQGAEHLFHNSMSELKKTCVLLTGVAMLTTKGSDDFIRKATAFGGLVQLPFFDTAPPKNRRQPRLALVPTTRSWCLYTLDSHGKPVVEISQRGFEGLVLCVLCLRDVL